MNATRTITSLCLAAALTAGITAAEPEREPAPTKEFEVKGDRPYLEGQPIELWGLRCGNALYSQAVTERHVRNLDNKFAPDIEGGVCPTYKSDTGTTSPGMQVGIIQKEEPIPKTGFVVNVETHRHDAYSNDGKYEYPGNINNDLLYMKEYSSSFNGLPGKYADNSIGGGSRGTVQK